MTSKRIRRSTLGVGLGSALLVFGCGSGESPKNLIQSGQTLAVDGDSGHVSGEISAPASIVEGRNEFLVSLNPSTAQISQANVVMPSMGHGSPTPEISMDGGTYHLSNVTFTMPGLWQVTLDVGVDTATDQIEFSVEAP